MTKRILTEEQVEAHNKRMAEFRQKLQPQLEKGNPADQAGKPTPKGKAAKIKARKVESYLEKIFAEQIMLCGLPAPTREFRPFEERRFRCDFAWPALKLIVEVDGEVHRISSRFHRDIEKQAMLLLAGWRCLRVGSIQVRDGTAIEWLKQLMPA